MAFDDFDNSLVNAFNVTIDGIEVPRVMEIGGLRTEVHELELKQQTKDGKYVVRRLIGRPKAGELTVTRGLTEDKTITDWLKTVWKGDAAAAPPTVVLALLDHQGETLKSYNFFNCRVESVELDWPGAGITGQPVERFIIRYDESNIS